MMSCATGGMASKKGCLFVLMTVVVASMVLDGESSHDYADALHKCLLFFEGQRSGKLPSDQRVKWRKDSALSDGNQANVDLVGGYYDAGDNLKFGFPMAFTTTVLAWSVVDFGKLMGSELDHARAAIRWATDYLLKATNVPNVVYVQVGEPYEDHNCWERPEDMDTSRNVYAVDKDHPGSEVAAETAAALAAAAMVFKSSDTRYSRILLERATQVFAFADKYRGSYSQSLGSAVCPFYCDFSGYEDELLWGALWLRKASSMRYYQKYVEKNMHKLNSTKEQLGRKSAAVDDQYIESGEFGWDDKHGGLNIIIAKDLLKRKAPRPAADEIVCGVLPESPTRIVEYSPGGVCDIYKNLSAVKKILLEQSVFGPIFISENHSFCAELGDTLLSLYYKDNIFKINEGVQVRY